MSKSNQEHTNVKSFSKATAHIYEFYLSGYIEEPEQYIEWFDTIRNATTNDQVKLYINSRGGYVDTALQFARAMGESDAFIIASVEGSCMSAATMIFLSADAFEITPNSIFMLHNYSGGMFGKGGEMYDQAIFEREWSKKLLTDTYQNFLTEKEIEALLDNKDLWFHSEEVSKRLKNVIEARNAEEDEEESELE